jgi:hypothetical protein
VPRQFIDRERLRQRDIIAPNAFAAARIGRAFDAPDGTVFGVEYLNDEPAAPRAWSLIGDSYVNDAMRISDAKLLFGRSLADYTGYGKNQD